MGFLAGKKVLIVGLATDRSIAWGIAQAMKREGAELAFTYQNDRIKERVVEAATELGSSLVMPMDVGIDTEIAAAFAKLKSGWGALDVLVHSVAFAPREALTGGFVEATTREAFSLAHDISSYSLTALARAAMPLMEGRNGAIVTLSYLGAVRSIPSYNVMGLAKASLEANVRFLAADLGARGIRVNAISAGPVKTLAAAGIGDFRYILKWNEYNTPLRRNVSSDEVGASALYLMSDLGRGVTGEVLHVDSGYHIIGLKNPDAPDMTLNTKIGKGE